MNLCILVASGAYARTIIGGPIATMTPVGPGSKVFVTTVRIRGNVLSTRAAFIEYLEAAAPGMKTKVELPSRPDGW